MQEAQSRKVEPDFLDVNMDFDSGEDDSLENEAPKRHLSKSVDDEFGPQKKRHSSQGSAKYVPPKINVKMPPPPPKAPQLQHKPPDDEKKKSSSRLGQQPVSHHQQQQQQYYHAQISQSAQSGQKVPQVAPPSYMHNLEKQPMTNREKFMSYKVQRLETKLEKTSAQLQKFRTGYQNLVHDLHSLFLFVLIAYSYLPSGESAHLSHLHGAFG